eukprot:6104294-Pyramimonas_sp.AAC.1
MRFVAPGSLLRSTRVRFRKFKLTTKSAGAAKGVHQGGAQGSNRGRLSARRHYTRLGLSRSKDLRYAGSIKLRQHPTAARNLRADLLIVRDDRESPPETTRSRPPRIHSV